MFEDRRWRIEDGAILDPPFSILDLANSIAVCAWVPGAARLISATLLLPRDLLEQLVPSFQRLLVLSECPLFFGIPALEAVVFLRAAEVQVL
jgi:hypothetical protein